MDSTGKTGLPAVLSVLDRLTEDELVQLNRIVVACLRLMQDIRSHEQMINLRVGQRVQFTSTSGQLIRGTLAKHKRKSVSVVCDDGTQWRVSPSLLQPA